MRNESVSRPAKRLEIPLSLDPSKSEGGEGRIAIDEQSTYGHPSPVDALRDVIITQGKKQGRVISEKWVAQSIAGVLRSFENAYEQWRIEQGAMEGEGSNAEFAYNLIFPSGDEVLLGSAQALQLIRFRERAEDPVPVLDPLENIPLSTQLQRLTGDTFNMNAWHSEHDPSRLETRGVVVHKATGARFRIPLASQYREVERLLVEESGRGAYRDHPDIAQWLQRHGLIEMNGGLSDVSVIRAGRQIVDYLQGGGDIRQELPDDLPKVKQPTQRLRNHKGPSIGI